MRLAVVIPSYNHAHYIHLALDSVLAQTRPADRIIVIDDGSTDASLQVLEPYKAKGVEVLARENRGAHHTLNQAIAMAAADCEFISILNSDDHYHPQRFAQCLPLLAADASKSVLVTGLQIIGSDDEQLPLTEPRARWFRAVWSWQHLPELDYCAWLGLGNFPATTSNLIARREFLLRYPFRPYRYNHDYYFLAQAVLRQQMIVHPELLVNYRVHATNTMNTKPVLLMREMVRMHLDLLHDLAPELPHDAALRAHLATYLRHTWQNISALPAGLLQVLLATAVGQWSEDQIQAAVAQLDEATWPEVREFPNKTLTNLHDGLTPVGEPAGLADKYSQLQAERKATKADADAWKALAKLRATMQASKWLALGRLLGVKFPEAGKSPADKLQSLQTTLGKSWWAQRAGLR